MDDTLWQGWLEFEPLDGGETLRSPRETTQPNRTDSVYWATGLSPVYIEGALQRALNPIVRAEPAPPAVPAFEGPAPATVSSAPPAPGSVLNPFSVYRKGEALLRDQLRALSAWHLVNIITAHGLSEMSEDQLTAMSTPELVELIVASVRIAIEETAPRA